MFELLDPEVFVSAAPRLLPLLAPDWNPPSVNRPVGTSPTLPQQKASDASFIHLTRLKLSLTLFLTVSTDLQPPCPPDTYISCRSEQIYPTTWLEDSS